jgi:peptidoglycan/xylan/chitin deacetylase (PgdA/CDA1 family)
MDIVLIYLDSLIGYMSHIYTKQKKNALNILSNLDYVYVDWNCLNRDSEKKYSNNQLLDNLKKSAKNKGTLIILMHDTADVNKTYDILKDSISYLRSQGYTFSNFYDFIKK